MTQKTPKKTEGRQARVEELTAHDLDKVSGGLIGDDVGAIRGDKLVGDEIGAVKPVGSIRQPEVKGMERVHEDE